MQVTYANRFPNTPQSPDAALDGAGVAAAWRGFVPVSSNNSGLAAARQIIRTNPLVKVPGNVSWTVRAAESESTQEYTPFEGFPMSAKVTDTFVRGHHVFAGGKLQAEAAQRPLAAGGTAQFRAISAVAARTSSR